MPLRSLRERIIQTVAFEAGGLLLVVPLYALAFGAPAAEAALLLGAVAAAVMIWSPLHNTAFDWLDLRLAGRVASDRPQHWRLVHAVSHEATSALVTLPIILAMTPLSPGSALLLDLGLTAFYAAYAYAFHLAFDLLRPVMREPSPRARPSRLARVQDLDGLRARLRARAVPSPTLAGSPMHLRSLGERAVQSVAFELVALPLAIPPLSFASGLDPAQSAILLLVLALTLMLWWPLHDTLFDAVHEQATGLVASDRTPGWRLAHALSREGTATLVTLPIILAVTGLDLPRAVEIDLGLALFYVGYTYVFHRAYDRLLPLSRAGSLEAGAQRSERPAAREPFGMHLMLDGYDADPVRLADGAGLRRLLDDLPAALGMHTIAPPQLVEVGPLNRKDPGGLSGVVMIAESHISFHTFPRRGFVTADIYTCQPSIDRDRVVRLLTEAFGIGSSDVFVQPRGVRYPGENLAEVSGAMPEGPAAAGAAPVMGAGPRL